MGDAYASPVTYQTTTTSYVSGDGATNTVDLEAYTHVTVYADVVIGSGTDVRLKFEFSDDGTTWFQEDSEDEATPGEVNRQVIEHLFDADGSHAFPLPKVGRYLRPAVKHTGTSSTSKIALSLNAVLLG